MDILSEVNKLIATPVYADSLGARLDQAQNLIQTGGGGSLQNMVNEILTIVIPVGVIAAMILLGVAGYTMITSQGNPDKINEAREIVTNAIIGLVIILMAVSILWLIKNSLNLPMS